MQKQLHYISLWHTDQTAGPLGSAGDSSRFVHSLALCASILQRPRERRTLRLRTASG